MHGDFSNITFSPDRHYSTVFDLQGRVGLDANRNEQTAILLHALRSAMADLVGPHAGPQSRCGFKISKVRAGDFVIGAGSYYVDGIRVDNPADVNYTDQPYAFIDPDRDADRLPPDRCLVYLKVFERHVTEVEDPSLHEPALGPHHPDSGSRAQVVWQVRARPLLPEEDPLEWITAQRTPRFTGVLHVRTTRDGEGGDGGSDDPCAIASHAPYTGENQLYRVEIRHGGTAREGAGFVWSRDNGSVIHPVLDGTGTTLRLTTLGRDRHTALHPGQWVELVDDTVSLRPELGLPQPAPRLHRVEDIDPDTLTVTLDKPPATPPNRAHHPYLRRWDHTPSASTPDGALPLTEGDWIPLEHGIEIRFERAPGRADHHYRSGDYWTFPARRTLPGILWPHPQGTPPHGVPYHYAPLAVLTGKDIKGLRTAFGVALAEGV
ncbi:DUF6519 domain-containing protein [Streptomyces sp. NPDC002888]|uniref:DUF6519 domain-containing protein n=1 Tax=Streptomyces sp. NPDC002888 TaxID=3364668 RepID=UPI00369B7798